ncbi:MAG: methionyl-tRNA formyltransferase [Coriobacteriales bacterium]|jgi:methionyl-tRNA formyltransferase|nr:methionyl-tRNA formyltransferase [Coriobacteriales bacterium]
MHELVFMGTPEFAVPTLEALASDSLSGLRVSLVVTRPDAVSGRGSALLPSPVRAAAERLGLPVITPASCTDISLPPCDLVVVAAFGMILAPTLLAWPRLGCVNVHASLLPRWRGAAPIQRALLAGDAKTGVSIMRLEEGLDSGAVCAQAAVEIGKKDALALGTELAHLGADLLIATLPGIIGGTARWVEQDPADVSYAAKVSKHELALRPELSARDNVRRVRASTPRAPARCRIGGRSVTVVSARCVVGVAEVAEAAAVATVAAVAAVATTPRLLLPTADGIFEVISLKPDGKQVMGAAAFMAGLRTRAVTWEAL